MTSIAAAEAGVLGLALLRREAEPGAMVDLAWEGGSARATVRAVSAG